MPNPIIARQTFDHIVALIEQGELNHRQIAALVGVTSVTVRNVAKGQHFHQQSEAEQERRQRPLGGREFVPTPKQIAEACAEIRRGWDMDRYVDWSVS